MTIGQLRDGRSRGRSGVGAVHFGPPPRLLLTRRQGCTTTVLVKTRLPTRSFAK